MEGDRAWPAPEGGVCGILQTAAAHGRLDVAGWMPSLTRMSVLTVFLSFFLTLMQDYGTDQVTVQRLMAVRHDRGVVRIIALVIGPSSK